MNTTAQTTSKTSQHLAAKVGTILVSTWGYEQTNVDYYEVIKASPKMVTLAQLEKTTTAGETWGHHYSVPAPGKHCGKPFRRKAHDYGDGLLVNINSFAVATEWNQRETRGTSYA